MKLVLVAISTSINSQSDISTADAVFNEYYNAISDSIGQT